MGLLGTSRSEEDNHRFISDMTADGAPWDDDFREVMSEQGSNSTAKSDGRD